MSEKKSQELDRRKFLDLLLSGSVIAVIGGLGYPLFRYLTPPLQEEAIVSTVNLGNVDDFKINSGQIFRFGSKPGIIIRGSDSQFHAYFATCTHLDCIVQYDDQAESIWCACHNGRYDINGLNISGPPPRPLDPLQVNITGQSQEVVITLPEGESS